MNDSTFRHAAALSLVLVATGCQSGDVRPTRLAPSPTVSVVACVLALPTTPGPSGELLASCAKQAPKIVSTGFDQAAIDGVLSGTAGPADPGIRTACAVSGRKRSIAGVETMGYGIVMDGESQRVLVVQQDDVTTYRRDGNVESARLSTSVDAKADTATAAPSACAMALAQALTVASICADQQWAGGGCAGVLAQLQFCGDPKRLMVDPDMGFACQPTVDAEAVTTAVATMCAQQNDGGTCAPTASVNGWLRDPGGICASPRASVTADKERCVVPITMKGPRGSADVTAVILWDKTTSGGPIFIAEPPKSRGFSATSP